MSNPLLDMLNQKKKQLDTKGNDFKPFRPPKGKTVLRILPSWRGLDEDGNPQPFWHDFGSHWIKAIDPKTNKVKVQAVFVCPDKTFGKECEVCATIGAAVNHAKDLGDENMEKLVKQSNAAENYLLNVLNLSGPEGERTTPITMQCGNVIFKQIVALMTTYLEEGIDITSIEEGVDLILERTGDGMDTEYTLNASPKGSRKQQYTGELPDIDAIIAAEIAKNKQDRALGGLSRAIGIEPPKAGAALPGPNSGSTSASAGSILDEAEAEDAEFEPTETTAAATEPDESTAEVEEEVNEDELEALLSSL